MRLALFFLCTMMLLASAADTGCPTCAGFAGKPQARVLLSLDEPNNVVYAYVYYENTSASPPRQPVKDSVLLVEVTNATGLKMLYKTYTNGNGTARFNYTSWSQVCVNLKVLYCPFCAPGTTGCAFDECLAYSKISNRKSYYDNIGTAGNITSSDDVPTGPGSYAAPSPISTDQYLPDMALLQRCAPPPPMSATPALCLPLLIVFSLLGGALYLSGHNPFMGFNIGTARVGRHIRYQARGRGFSMSAMSVVSGVSGAVGGAVGGGKKEAKEGKKSAGQIAKAAAWGGLKGALGVREGAAKIGAGPLTGIKGAFSAGRSMKMAIGNLKAARKEAKDAGKPMGFGASAVFLGKSVAAIAPGMRQQAIYGKDSGLQQVMVGGQMMWVPGGGGGGEKRAADFIVKVDAKEGAGFAAKMGAFCASVGLSIRKMALFAAGQTIFGQMLNRTLNNLSPIWTEGGKVAGKDYFETGVLGFMKSDYNQRLADDMEVYKPLAKTGGFKLSAGGQEFTLTGMVGNKVTVTTKDGKEVTVELKPGILKESTYSVIEKVEAKDKDGKTVLDKDGKPVVVETGRSFNMNEKGELVSVTVPVKTTTPDGKIETTYATVKPGEGDKPPTVTLTNAAGDKITATPDQRNSAISAFTDAKAQASSVVPAEITSTIKTLGQDKVDPKTGEVIRVDGIKEFLGSCKDSRDAVAAVQATIGNDISGRKAELAEKISDAMKKGEARELIADLKKEYAATELTLMTGVKADGLGKLSPEQAIARVAAAYEKTVGSPATVDAVVKAADFKKGDPKAEEFKRAAEDFIASNSAAALSKASRDDFTKFLTDRATDRGMDPAAATALGNAVDAKAFKVMAGTADKFERELAKTDLPSGFIDKICGTEKAGGINISSVSALSSANSTLGNSAELIVKNTDYIHNPSVPKEARENLIMYQSIGGMDHTVKEMQERTKIGDLNGAQELSGRLAEQHHNYWEGGLGVALAQQGGVFNEREAAWAERGTQAHARAAGIAVSAPPQATSNFGMALSEGDYNAAAAEVGNLLRQASGVARAAEELKGEATTARLETRQAEDDLNAAQERYKTAAKQHQEARQQYEEAKKTGDPQALSAANLHVQESEKATASSGQELKEAEHRYGLAKGYEEIVAPQSEGGDVHVKASRDAVEYYASMMATLRDLAGSGRKMDKEEASNLLSGVAEQQGSVGNSAAALRDGFNNIGDNGLGRVHASVLFRFSALGKAAEKALAGAE